MFKRVDRISDTNKPYFYINTNNKEYGLCINERDLSNISDIEKELITDNKENRLSLERLERR